MVKDLGNEPIIFNDDKHYLKNFIQLNETGILDNQYGQCMPNVYVMYNREYFKIGPDRFTIDTDIQYQLYSYNFIREEFNSIV